MLIINKSSTKEIDIFLCLFRHILSVIDVSNKLFGFLPQLINTNIIIPAHQSIIFIQINLQDVTFFNFIGILILFIFG